MKTLLSIFLLLTSHAALAWGPYAGHPNSMQAFRSDISAGIPSIAWWTQSDAAGKSYWYSQFSNMPRTADCSKFYTANYDWGWGTAGGQSVKIVWTGLGAGREILFAYGNNQTPFVVKADASGTATFQSANFFSTNQQMQWRAKKNSGANYGTCPTTRPTITVKSRCVDQRAWDYPVVDRCVW